MPAANPTSAAVAGSGEAVSFDISRKEAALVSKCVTRFAKAAKALGQNVDRQSASMDLTACHANGNPMDFARLLAADDFNFAHDVCGIERHLDRNTGKLGNHFRPRFSLRTGAPA